MIEIERKKVFCIIYKVVCEFLNTEGQKTLGPYNKLYTISKQYADMVIIPLCMSVSPEYDMLIVICVQQEIVKSYQNRALIFYH